MAVERVAQHVRRQPQHKPVPRGLLQFSFGIHALLPGGLRAEARLLVDDLLLGALQLRIGLLRILRQPLFILRQSQMIRLRTIRIEACEFGANRVFACPAGLLRHLAAQVVHCGTSLRATLEALQDVRSIGSGRELYGKSVERQARGLGVAQAEAQGVVTGGLAFGDLVASRGFTARPVETLAHLRHGSRRRQRQKIGSHCGHKIARIAFEAGNVTAHACHAAGQIVAFLDQLRRELPGVDRRQRFDKACIR